MGRLRLREQIGHQRLQVLWGVPLARRRAIAESGEERARVPKIVGGIAIGSAQAQPDRLEPISQRRTIALLDCGPEDLPHPGQANAVGLGTVLHSTRVDQGLPNE